MDKFNLNILYLISVLIRTTVRLHLSPYRSFQFTLFFTFSVFPFFFFIIYFESNCANDDERKLEFPDAE